MSVYKYVITVHFFLSYAVLVVKWIAMLFIEFVLDYGSKMNDPWCWRYEVHNWSFVSLWSFQALPMVYVKIEFMIFLHWWNCLSCMPSWDSQLASGIVKKKFKLSVLLSTRWALGSSCLNLVHGTFIYKQVGLIEFLCEIIILLSPVSIWI